MADITGAVDAVLGVVDGFQYGTALPPSITGPLDGDVTLRTFRERTYIMRGRDTNCGTLTYREWSSALQPDFTGAKYAGAFCGVSLSLTDIVVLRIEENG